MGRERDLGFELKNRGERKKIREKIRKIKRRERKKIMCLAWNF
jgi:hypothetical protein